jgi:hypothetical protein
MRFVVALIAMAVLCKSADAQTRECKSLTDPATRLACYDKANPPIATYPTPAPKPVPNPAAPRLLAPAAKADTMGGMDSLNEEDTRVNAQLKNICRGC